jgi:general secretion pathway protein G
VTYSGKPKQDGTDKVDADIRTARISIDELSVALDLFEIDCDRYPTKDEGLQALIQKPENVFRWQGPYVKDKALLLDPWKHPYRYTCADPRGGWYTRHSCGPDGQFGTEDDVTGR